MLFQVFAGNTDRNTVITHSFRPHIDARFIRFHPKTHNHNIPCLRVELYGCRKGKFSADKESSFPFRELTRSSELLLSEIKYSLSLDVMFSKSLESSLFTPQLLHKLFCFFSRFPSISSSSSEELFNACRGGGR